MTEILNSYISTKAFLAKLSTIKDLQAKQVQLLKNLNVNVEKMYSSSKNYISEVIVANKGIQSLESQAFGVLSYLAAQLGVFLSKIERSLQIESDIEFSLFARFANILKGIQLLTVFYKDQSLESLKNLVQYVQQIDYAQLLTDAQLFVKLLSTRIQNKLINPFVSSIKVQLADTRVFVIELPAKTTKTLLVTKSKSLDLFELAKQRMKLLAKEAQKEICDFQSEFKAEKSKLCIQNESSNQENLKEEEEAELKNQTSSLE